MTTRHIAKLIWICYIAAGAVTFAAAESLPAPKPAPVPEMPRSIRSDAFNAPVLKPVDPTAKKKGVKSRSSQAPIETSSELTNIDQEPAAIQQMHRMIVWFVPLVGKLPPSYANSLGVRIQNQMYDILDELVTAKSEKENIKRLQSVKSKLDVLRHQTWLLLDLRLVSKQNFLHAADLMNQTDAELDDWIKPATEQ